MIQDLDRFNSVILSKSGYDLLKPDVRMNNEQPAECCIHDRIHRAANEGSDGEGDEGGRNEAIHIRTISMSPHEDYNDGQTAQTSSDRLHEMAQDREQWQRH